MLGKNSLSSLASWAARDGDRYQVLLGVTGSGKTFTMAKTIEALGKPTLVMAPNKTLAAQLASELKEFFPNNAVVYFVSYYDYYQPEAYVPQSDTYIEKDSSINEEVEMLRHQATASLLSRRDVIVVASVSCIYGIGSPEDYAGLAPNVDKKVPLERDAVTKTHGLEHLEIIVSALLQTLCLEQLISRLELGHTLLALFTD